MSDLALIYSAVVDWAQEDVLRPVIILVCAALLFNLPTTIYKVRMVIRGLVYFFLCWDKSWEKPQDPGSIFGPHLSQGLPVQRKTVYFVRHGESTWNDTFNKGKHRSALEFVLGFIPGLVKSLIYEAFLVLTGKIDRCGVFRITSQFNFSIHRIVPHIAWVLFYFSAGFTTPPYLI